MQDQMVRGCTRMELKPAVGLQEPSHNRINRVLKIQQYLQLTLKLCSFDPDQGF